MTLGCMRFAAAALAVMLPSIAHSAECAVESGARRNALVELYTSEGCSSCPDADRQLSLIGAPVNAQVVALALHVNFWDYLGWKDPYARAEFTERQRWLVGVNGARTLYTPHFFVGGREVADRGRVGTVIREQSAGEAKARIRARWVASAQGPQWRIDSESAAGGHLALFAALTENGLSNQVVAGENSGRRLNHDHVVRQWAAPVAFRSGRAELALSPVSSNAKGRRDLVAFVQDTRSGEVLQALKAPACKAG